MIVKSFRAPIIFLSSHGRGFTRKKPYVDCLIYFCFIVAHCFDIGCYHICRNNMKDHLFVKSLYLPVLRILNKYAQVSGHIINLEKSTMTFSPGMLQPIREVIQNLMGIQVVPKFDKYLGMLAVVGRSKKDVFSFLKDRVWDRVKKWNVRDFSMAGREVLIKAVLQAIPTYVMSCFLLPVSII